jgi:hypothetical protein
MAAASTTSAAVPSSVNVTAVSTHDVNFLPAHETTPNEGVTIARV